MKMKCLFGFHKRMGVGRFTTVCVKCGKKWEDLELREKATRDKNDHYFWEKGKK